MILITSKASLPAFRVVKNSKCCTRIFPSRGINTLENLNSDAKHNDAFLESAGVPGVVSLCLNRPVSRNAISLRLLKEFRLCLESIYSRKDARVLVIRSTSPAAFCAGADLIERRTMSESQVSQFLSDLRSALHRLENLPIPTIAAIDGAALGGGLELALACDFRIAGMHVQKIGFPETRLGIIPAAGGTQRASRLLGESKAKDLIYTGRLLSGSEAAAWGLVNYVSDSESTALARSLALAQEILPSAPLAIRAAKAAISQAVDKTLEEGLDLERQCYQPLLASQDRVEALKAFKEKRAPVFQGI